MSLCVSTPVGDSIVVERVFRSCVVIVQKLNTNSNLIILDMVHFDIIRGMDWLSHYHKVMDYFTKIIILAMSGIH